MKIVVLDGYTLNPGDLSWEKLEAFGECAVYDRTAPEHIVERTGDAEIVLTNKAVLSADVIRRLTKLRYIGVLATGYNIVDVEAARERGVPVSNVPTYGTGSVAQMVFAHLLNLTQHVAYHARTVREGRWAACPDFCYWDMPLFELAGLTLGVVGFGRIGRATAELARAFGMKVIACDVTAPAVMPEGCRMVEQEEVFRQADVLSLHCPLTPQTERLVNAQRLATMKPTAFLINTSRGPLIDEQALADALDAGRLAGAGLDVLSEEPPARDNPLLKARNCFITPHIAWATRSARERLLRVAIDNVAAFIAGKPQNVVNGQG
ncbi:MAG: D-2-hydroxyacid dehydrogenase [Phycisphaerales bacterium]|nr:MAG: D-2-hydroxyacid dehydrogenase [Phycisphaerales bacterium]